MLGNKENRVPACEMENWIGKLLDLCAQNKLDSAKFEFVEEGPPNERLFTAYAIVGESKGMASGRKRKKEAKNAAARELLMILQAREDSIPNAVDEFAWSTIVELGAEDYEYEGLLEEPGVNLSSVQTEQEPQKALENIMSDETRFLSAKCSYKDLEQPSTRGCTQSILKMKYNKVPPPVISRTDKKVVPSFSFEGVFCGEEVDSASARDEAARN
ncbi:hypothetical protein PMAYCL1PPCAC_13328, partial [Pristionchus mayeri]